MITVDLAPINQGSTHVITMTVSGAGLDLTTALGINFIISADTASAAMVSKTLSSGIAVVNSTTATIALAGSDTNTLAGTYHYEIRCVNATGQTDLTHFGSVTIRENVTG